MRLVLDTNIIASSFRSRDGASRAIVEAFEADQFVLVISQPLFTEYEDVLKRPEQLLVHGASIRRIDEFLDNLATRAVRVSLQDRIRPQLRDPNDEMVLETAVTGRADAIVTHNVRDFLPESNKFNIPIRTPGHIMNMRFLR